MASEKMDRVLRAATGNKPSAFFDIMRLQTEVEVCHGAAKVRGVVSSIALNSKRLTDPIFLVKYPPGSDVKWSSKNSQGELFAWAGVYDIIDIFN